MNRLEEIETRLNDIANQIKTQSSEIDEQALTNLESEITGLKEERKTLKESIERRKSLLKNIANDRVSGTVVRNFSSDCSATETSKDRFNTIAYRNVFFDYVAKGGNIPAEYRTNATSTTTDVGAVIPTVILDKIVEKLEATGMIIPLVTQTAYKGGFSIPVSSVKPTATWVNEGNSSDTQKHTIEKNGMITFAYHKLRCAVAVSVEVDNLSIATFETMLVKNIVEAMTKAIEQAIISGTGNGQPKGILTETVPEKQTLQISAPAYSNLIDAEAALPQAYEKDAVWCMSKQTFMQYYGLTDSSGQPIGRVNYGINGKPERSLLGRTVICCDYVSSFNNSLTAGTKFAFLFNFKDYVLNTNYNMGIKKYEDDETDDTVTKAVMIVDGKVIDKNSLVVLSKKA